MIVGIPKEQFNEEKRVALAPAGVDALTRKGHTIYVQSRAGEGSHFNDEDYEKTGAKIVYTADEIFGRAELVLKVSQINDAELELFRENQILFSFLHLAVGKKHTIEKLMQKKVTAIGYDLVENNNRLPVLQAMSEIAGPLSIQIASRYLESYPRHGRGILLGGITGVAPAAVVVLGAGVVGTNAARAALGIGAQVIVIDKDLNRLHKIDEHFMQNITTVVANPYTIERGVKFADVLIGAVLMKGEKTPHLVTEDMVRQMKPGAVIIDVSIDQGGCIETSRLTTLSDPVFEKYNIIHYCVPNMPALVARTASYGLTNASLPYIQDITDNGLANALLGDEGLANGVCTYNGFCSNEQIANIFNVEYRKLRIFSTN